MYSKSFLVQFGFFTLLGSSWKAANFQKTYGSWYIMGLSANVITAVCNSTISAPVWSSGDFDKSCTSCSLNRSTEFLTKYE
ncbi:hypothetical protein CI238_13568, partial [Colletotrichum incanum]